MYSFYHSTESQPEETQVYPIYGDDFGLKYTNQDNVVYKKKEIVGTITLAQDDFDLVIGNDPDDYIFIRIEGGDINQITYFHLRAATIDHDNKTVEISLLVEDGYAHIEKVLDKPVNWLDYVEKHDPQDIPCHPVIQVYVAGQQEITIFSKGGYWTQRVERVVSWWHTLTGLMHFGNSVTKLHARTTSTAFEAQNSLIFDDLRTAHATDESFSDCGRYKLWTELEQVGGDPQDIYGTFVITDTDTNERMFESHQQHVSWLDITVQPLYSETHGIIQFQRLSVYARIVSARTDGQDWHTASGDDIMPRSIYRFVRPIDPSVIHISAAYYTVPAYPYFGEDFHHAFYPLTPPVHPAPGSQYIVLDIDYIPVNPDRWHGVSIWLEPHQTLLDMMDAAGTYHRHTIYHTYTFEDMINAMLTGLGLDLTYIEVEDSAFFSDMLTDEFSHINVVPAGNIITWNYTAPTTKHEITLGQVFENLEKMFNAYWHIDGGRLKIEQAMYYYKGGKYHGQEFDIHQDLTTSYEMRGIKRLGEDQNTVRFEEVDIPDMVRFAFTTECSTLFRGYDIRYSRQEGVIEDVTIELFSTDVLYCMLNPTAFDPSGLFLMNSGRIQSVDDNWNMLEYGTFSVVNSLGGDVTFTLLNNRLSMTYLLDRYFNTNLLRFNAYINTVLRNANSFDAWLKRTMLQDVEFPVDGELDWLKLYKTEMGEGRLHEAIHHLNTNHVTGTLVLVAAFEKDLS